MRRVILMLLVVLLPLNGWAAAALPFCAHSAAGGMHASMDARADLAVGHGHGHEHAEAGTSEVREGHPGHDGHAAHDAHAMHDGDALTAHGEVAGDPDCVHADCGACCHATGSAAFGVASVALTGPDFAYVPVGVVAASPDSPALDGPFRPPRTATA